MWRARRESGELRVKVVAAWMEDVSTARVEGGDGGGEGQMYREDNPRPWAQVLCVRLASNLLVELADASWGLGGTGPREGRVDELLERGRELRHDVPMVE